MFMIVTPIISNYWVKNIVVMFKMKQILCSGFMTGMKHDGKALFSAVTIEDLAYYKCHQQLNKIFLFLFLFLFCFLFCLFVFCFCFYLHYIWEISKVFYKKTLSCNTPLKLDAIMCDQHALVIIACAGFVQHMPDKSFLVNNFADFPDVQAKKK